MNALLEPGKYVVAVSGGIDSVVLLDMLRQDHALDLVVAHYDHGIRDDSADDAAFVTGLVAAYGLELEMAAGKLGEGASEDTARRHRYAFLREACARRGAQAVVTAHHQDDVIETALLNIQRGTKRRGLISLRSTAALKRPMLKFTKKQIRDYAINHQSEWVEDSTNSQMKYARNRVRARLYKHLTAKKRQEIMQLLEAIEGYDSQINSLVNEILLSSRAGNNKGGGLDKTIIRADEMAAAEIIAAWLRKSNAAFDKLTISRIIKGTKKLRNGSKIDIDKNYYCLLTKDEIVLTRRESV